MKKRRFAFWVIVAALATACGQHPDVAARFNYAEKLMMFFICGTGVVKTGQKCISIKVVFTTITTIMILLSKTFW